MIPRPANVLVEGCDEPLPKTDENGGARSFVAVSLSGSVGKTLSALNSVAEPDKVHVVCLSSDDVTQNVDYIHVVESPEDLSSLSMKIGKTVSDSQGDDLYLYFDSISELLKHTETMKGYRFINALTGRLRNADAVGYFRMPTEEHEAEVVDTFGSLFSHSVGTDGEIMVID